MGLKLDISAPQFILPQDLSDSKSYMVVFDLGRLKVTNLLDQGEEEEEEVLPDHRDLLERRGSDEAVDDLDGTLGNISSMIEL